MIHKKYTCVYVCVYIYITVENDKVSVVKCKILGNMVGYIEIPIQFLQIFCKSEINMCEYMICLNYQG